MRLHFAICAALALSSVTVLAQKSDDPDTESARRHFDKAKGFYDQRKYEEALGEFEAARQVKPLPAFDFNIARCHDRLERYDKAIPEYQRYLDEIPPSSADVAEVRERIRMLRIRIDEINKVKHPPPAKETPPPELTPTPTVTPTPAAARKRPSLILPIAVGGGAVVLAIVGGALYGSVASQYNAILNDSPGAICQRPCTGAQVAPLEARAGAGIFMWALAGAGAIADTVLWVLWLRKPHADTAKVALRPLVVPAPGGLMVLGRF